tara:strand:- start:76 stop:354 length:279 start_codon:yes stop_codon:yes gene_type:complete
MGRESRANKRFGSLHHRKISRTVEVKPSHHARLCTTSPDPANHPQRFFLLIQTRQKQRASPDRTAKAAVICLSWRGELANLQFTDPTQEYKS